MRELRQHVEWNDLLRQVLCDQVNAPRRAVPEKMRSPIKVPDQAWVEPHQLRTHEVRRNRIVGENDLAEVPMHSVQGSVALHGNHAIRDHEMNRRRGADVENAAMDSFPVEDIFGPAILGPRHNAEHILHAERHAGPMVGLDLRHGDDEVGRNHGPGQPQMLQARVGWRELTWALNQPRLVRSLGIASTWTFISGRCPKLFPSTRPLVDLNAVEATRPLRGLESAHSTRS
jgi:hypothetical protein